MVSHSVAQALTAAFGPRQPTALSPYIYRTAITILLFLAYELGYWLNHYLSHRVPFLWEFHKVHHSATVLTPLTNFRVHPVYMCIFLNILALFIGTANGLGDYIFGQATHQYVLSENNIILVFFIYLYVHLQHTQLWISFTGWLGHLFMSPAHHQIHHSRNPAHFNKNLGSCLALWDWMFGTLYVPASEPEELEFGVEPDRPNAHTIRGELFAPFGRAALRLKPQIHRRPRRQRPPLHRAGLAEGALEQRIHPVRIVAADWRWRIVERLRRREPTALSGGQRAWTVRLAGRGLQTLQRPAPAEAQHPQRPRPIGLVVHHPCERAVAAQHIEHQARDERAILGARVARPLAPGLQHQMRRPMARIDLAEHLSRRRDPPAVPQSSPPGANP